MADAPREAWITGIGIVSCLGEGADAHWQGLAERRIKVDAETFAPYLVHPLAPLDLDKQIPKKGDQRQMEPWQRIGTYAAGLALADADVAVIRTAGLLHDIGRLSVPTGIWNKPAPLSPSEWDRVRLHTYYTERILLQSPLLEPAARRNTLDALAQLVHAPRCEPDAEAVAGRQHQCLPESSRERHVEHVQWARRRAAQP